MTSIKLCGISREQDVLVLNEIKPEYAGFVFWEKSHRNISIDKAKQLRELLDSKIQTVGVFVDASVDFIKKLYDEKIIQIAQLHGNESESQIDELKSYGIKVIKAFKVSNSEEVVNAGKSNADYIMFDPGKGNGETFNWELIKDVERPYFLAGGLNPGNVQAAISMLKPYAVDVSSGIETDKVKDSKKMRDFVQRVREV